MYVNWGEGQADVEMIGLTPYDDNQQINEFKAQYGLTNPCAGVEGDGPEAIAVVIDGQPFFGYPTYCVVCPDRKLYFNVCFPPTPECFDSYILACGATGVEEMPISSNPFVAFPNPANEVLNIQFSGNEPISIELVNQLGKMVRKFETSVTESHIALPIAGLPSGMYFLRVETGKGVFTEKVNIY